MPRVSVFLRLEINCDCNTTDAFMEFNTLPPEIRFEIFSHLTAKELQMKAALVSKEWSQFAFYLLKDLELNSKQSQNEIIRISKLCNHVRRLILTDISNWTLVPSLPRWQFLRKIEFNTCEMTAVDMSELVVHFPAIEAIKINFHEIQHEIIDQVVNWKYLKEISLATNGRGWSRTEGLRLNLIATKCNYLERIEMRRVTVDFNSLQRLIDSRGPSLTKLKIDFLSYNFEDHITADAVMDSAIRSCSKLTHLTAFFHYGTFAVRNLKQLEELELTHLSGESDFEWRLHDFFSGIKFLHLRELTFTFCDILDDFGLECMTLSCPNLLRLKIWGCDDISDNGISVVVRGSRNLQDIELRSLQQLTNVSFHWITSELPALRNFSIMNCFHVSAEEIFFAECHRPHLKIEYFQTLITQTNK